MIALYNSTNGHNWRNNDNWLTDRPLYDWFGLEVDIDGRVTEINLSTNRLDGSLPPELAELDQLERLYMESSNLSGVIPREFGRLTRLQSLDLGSNKLTGPVPHEIGLLPDLEYLQLSGNNLSGEIPPSIMRSDTLAFIHLTDNQLTGDIPSEFAERSKITILDLSRNQLSSEIPPNIGQLRNLRELLLDENQLKGEIPPSIGQLRLLTEFIAFNNQLTGRIPEEISNLHSLKWLSLDNNRLTGPVPEGLANLEQLEWLEIVGNNFSGCIPTGLRQVERNNVFFANIPVCGETERADPVVPPYVNLAIVDAATPVQILATELGAQWISEFVADLGWPTTENTITVYVDHKEGLAQHYTNHVGDCDLVCARYIINVTESTAVAGAVFVPLIESGIAPAGQAQRTARLVFHAMHIEVSEKLTSSGRYRDPQWWSDGLATLFAELAIADGMGLPRDERRRDIAEWMKDWLEPLWELEGETTTRWQGRGAVAIDLLASQVGLPKLIEFYTERIDGEDWRQTFQRVFNISVPDFYDLFNEYQRNGLPFRELPVVGSTDWPESR